MSFSRTGWIAFFAVAVFSFADLFGERIALGWGRRRKWFRDIFEGHWWLFVWPYLFTNILLYTALTLQFVAGFLFLKNSNEDADNYTLVLAFFFSSSVAWRLWCRTLFGGGYIWISLLFIIGSFATAVVAFAFMIVQHEGVSAGLYAVYGLWLIAALIFNLVIIFTRRRYRLWRLPLAERSIVSLLDMDSEFDIIVVEKQKKRRKKSDDHDDDGGGDDDRGRELERLDVGRETDWREESRTDYVDMERGTSVNRKQVREVHVSTDLALTAPIGSSMVYS
jgi:signal transduction histidine kinase